MDLTPETLRSATFRDKLRGYHPDDVDEFLESVARGLEVLLARLRDATEKARAVAPVVEPTPQSDEAVKTLQLAQRTADLAIHEAKTEAERLVKAAEQKARRAVADAEDTAARLAETAQAELRADLERLQTARDQLFGEVQALGSWLDGERGRIKRALIEVADRIENVRDAGDAPVPKEVSIPAPPRQKLEEQRKAPPVERPKAAVTPPPAAPAPYQKGNTPPGGQPAVRPTPQPQPRPQPQPQPQAQPQPPATPPRPIAQPADAAVLSRAQQGVAHAAAEEDDDPFFAELRAAMMDETPLGPRDDEDE